MRKIADGFYEKQGSNLGVEPSQSAPVGRSQIPPFVTCGDIFPQSGGSLSSQGELYYCCPVDAEELPPLGELASRSDD